MKRAIIIILIVAAVGLGFYLGYQRVYAPKPIPANTSSSASDQQIVAKVKTQIDDIVAVIRSKVMVEYSYAVGTTINFKVSLEQSAKLNCIENPYGLKEILFYPHEDKETKNNILSFYCIWNNGEISGGGVDLVKQQFFRGHKSGLGFIAHWSINDREVSIEYLVETNPEKVKQYIAEIQGSGIR
ncbi:MAG: hypothetical protein ACE14V_04685 [bacterium]